MKKLIAATFACAALAVCADDVPEVSGVTMAQGGSRRLVTITYNLANTNAVITLDIQTNANGNVWASIGGENIQNVSGDVWKKVEAGDKHTITWRPDLSWPDHKIADGGARAVVTAWSVDNPPDYMVVNLAANAKANSETYYPAVEFLPGGLLGNPIYRTSQLVMRKIPAQGVTWEMGSRSNEPGRTVETEMMHTVTLADNYYIAVFTITQSQWALIQTSNAWPSYFTTDRDMRPVEQISYNEIRNSTNSTVNANYYYPKDPNPSSFLGLLRTKTGLAFDLPSEAQWEFACRAGHGTGLWGDGSQILSTGTDEQLTHLGRVCYNGGRLPGATENTYSDPKRDCVVTNGAAIVGSYTPNSWGLYDMHGNMWEWCLDWFTEDITDLDGAVNTVAGSKRVIRGGAWNSDARYCRAARRDSYVPANTRNTVGFRLALPASPALTAE